MFSGVQVVLLLTLIFVAAAGPGGDCADCPEEGPSPELIATSVHGFMECTDCHIGAANLPHDEDVGEVDCSACHEDATAQYAGSVHGQVRASGAIEAPDCESCHGNAHTLLSNADVRSPVYSPNLPDTCGRCHSDSELVAKFGIPLATPIDAYRQSVHFQLGEEGEPAASCSDCHGSHGIQSAGDPHSTVFHFNVPETCGRCHEGIAGAYERSVHGKAMRHGASEAPVCTDCHGEHRILGPDRRDSPIFATNIPKLTCGRCHGDVRLATKYNLPAYTVQTYENSFHGLATRAGRTTVAHCGSCHGVHEILPSSDPDSHVNKSNLAATCGACHPGAGEEFTVGKLHPPPTGQGLSLVYWIRRFYIWLIVVTIGAMALHNGLDLYRKARSPLPVRGTTTALSRIRMSRAFRVAHGALAVAFVVLVYSGFALAYPESWWAAPLLHWEGQLAVRGWVHRAAAILLLATFLSHLVHLAVSRAARSVIRQMLPTLRDFSELRRRLRWFLGKRNAMPKSLPIAYPEKIEYMALLWGTVIMSLTGFVLWFENLTLRIFPKWFTDVATVIHFYEAILASLAILVWHLYFVIFDPVIYPMDTSWLNGREMPGRAVERECHDEPVRADVEPRKDACSCRSDRSQEPKSRDG